MNRYLQYSVDQKANAIDAINGGMPIKTAAKQFGVPRSTLQDIIKGRIEMGAKIGGQPTLNHEEERELVDFACNRSQMGMGFNKQTLLRYAGKIADKKGKPFLGGNPSEKWWRGFKKRHPDLPLRTPESTASVRMAGMQPVRVMKFFHSYRGVIDGYDFQRRQIWNMDESGFQMDFSPPRGVKTVPVRSSGNKELVTVIGCASAVGQILNPHFVVKGKTRLAATGFDVERAPKNWNISASDSGWTKQGIGLLWFEETFLKAIGSERPQLLIVDGHNSHNFVELIEKARENRIVIVELPSHTSNWLQPLDRTVFGPLKKAWKSTCSTLMADNPGVIMNSCNSIVGETEINQVVGPINDYQTDMTDDLATGVSITKACPADRALSVIESTLTKQQLAKYDKRYQEGFDLKSDALYMTWKRLKEKSLQSDYFPFDNTSSRSSKLSDILKYHQAKARKPCQPKPCRPTANYFVITSDEAYVEKCLREEKKSQEPRNKKLKTITKKTLPAKKQKTCPAIEVMESRLDHNKAATSTDVPAEKSSPIPSLEDTHQELRADSYVAIAQKGERGKKKPLFWNSRKNVAQELFAADQVFGTAPAKKFICMDRRRRRSPGIRGHYGAVSAPRHQSTMPAFI
ncbi:uncharacterized protein LOC141915188 [Tubulanus polymorphus]|uniref:uncharacterized protein LOC141915188 n=1 Tax=Tubulanus polymorphus TaxID=672921 RepID=UPI003DA273EC